MISSPREELYISFSAPTRSLHTPLSCFHPLNGIVLQDHSLTLPLSPVPLPVVTSPTAMASKNWMYAWHLHSPALTSAWRSSLVYSSCFCMSPLGCLSHLKPTTSDTELVTHHPADPRIPTSSCSGPHTAARLNASSSLSTSVLTAVLSALPSKHSPSPAAITSYWTGAGAF